LTAMAVTDRGKPQPASGTNTGSGPRLLAYFFLATTMISTFVFPSSCTPTQARVGGFF